MLYLTGKYGTPLVPRLKWVLCNMVVGFGALDAFFECSESPAPVNFRPGTGVSPKTGNR